MGYPSAWLFTYLLSPLSISTSCVSEFHRGCKIGEFLETMLNIVRSQSLTMLKVVLTMLKIVLGHSP